jgi:predicted ABC-type sugar transport system permease subunit
MSHRLAWPLITLLLLLAVNTAFNASFLHLEWRDGHLYGSLIDILNRAAPLMLAALGMTLVIATRGIDISVGAVVAHRGIVAADADRRLGRQRREPLPDVARHPRGHRHRAAVRPVERPAGGQGGLQPIVATLILMVAGRGLAQLLTDGQIVTVYYKPFFFLGSGYLLGLPFSLFVVAAVFVLLYPGLITRTALGLFIQAVGINPVAARLAGIRRRGAGRLRLCVLQRLRRRGGPADQLQHQERGRQQRRPAARARRDPGRHAGRHLARRRRSAWWAA